MLETPKSAKTPSTFGIPNSCTTSAILENGDSTSVTFSPKLFSRSRANSSASASRSRLIKRPDTSRCAIASECPPAPSVASMYVPPAFTCSHSSTSSNIAGVWGLASLTTSASHHLFFAALNSQRVQRFVVLVGIRLVLHFIQHSRVIHYFQAVHHAKHVHIALGLRRLAQHRRQQNSSLPIHLHHLPEVARPHQKFSFGLVRRRQRCQLVFDFRPNLHRINSR